LVLELERHVRRLEEGEAGPVVELEERVQHAGACAAAGHRRLDLEGVDQRQAEEVLVELPGLLRIAAAIGVVMQSLYHGCAPVVLTPSPRSCPRSRRGSR